MTDVLPESDDDMLSTDEELDPISDAEKNAVKNRAKVGSARPSSLLYTYGPGAIMDLPHFSIMPAGLGDWDRIWQRRPGPAGQQRSGQTQRPEKFCHRLHSSFHL